MVGSTACRAPSFSIWARVIMTRSYPVISLDGHDVAR